MRHFAAVFLFFIISITQLVFAQIPQTISYQGILTDNKGGPVPDGNVSLTFKLYNASEGGDTLWQETQSVMVTKGIFNVILGSVKPLNLPFDQQYWLGITIDGNEELSPRTALTASPYSLNSHSTITEPVPGQDLLIKNANGEITHELNANGDVKHTGTGTFMGGIVVGDTVVVPFDTLTNIFGRNTKFLKKNTIGEKAGIMGIGVDAEGEHYGVLGISQFGTGVGGQSVNGAGVAGLSQNDIGVIGLGKVAGVWSWGKLKVDSIPPAPNQDRFLVWDNDNFVKFRTLPAAGNSFNGILDDKPLILKDANGDTVFSVMTNGESVHKGEETFLSDIKLTDAKNGPGMFIDQRSIVLFDKKGGGGGAWSGDFGFTSLKPVKIYDTLKVVDAQGNIVTMFAPDGTSLHKGDETFEGDIILKGPRGKGIKLVDNNGTTLAGLGRTDLDTGQRLGVYGKAQQPGDLAGAFQGDVEVRGEIAATSLHVVNTNGDTLVSFNADGTSFHKGKETYSDGTDVTTKTKESAITAGKFPSNLLSQFNQKISPKSLPSLNGKNINLMAATANNPVIWGYTALTDGAGILGESVDPNNTYPANWGVNLGGGSGVVGEVRNTSSIYPALWGIEYGTGTALLIDHKGSSGDIFIGRSSGSNKVRIDRSGKGFFNGGTQTGGADVAEAFNVEGAVQEYEPGDVLVISTEDDRTVMKSNQSYSTLVVGVYATKPGVLLTEHNVDDPLKDYIPMGVIGVIPTKVCGENGSIHRGDLLVTSSLPGYAMKGTDREKLTGAVIGKALQNFNGNGTGIIKVLVNTK